MRFNTTHPGGDSYDGVVVAVGEDFIALREEEGFVFDGIQVLPSRVIDSVRDDRYDRCANEIIRVNGNLNRLKCPAWLLKCSSLNDVISSVNRRSIWPAIEVLSDDGNEGVLYLGPITHMEDVSFKLHCYDATGKWEREYKLNLGELFRIEFDSNYCNNFNRYMQGKSSIPS